MIDERAFKKRGGAYEDFGGRPRLLPPRLDISFVESRHKADKSRLKCPGTSVKTTRRLRVAAGTVYKQGATGRQKLLSLVGLTSNRRNGHLENTGHVTRRTPLSRKNRFSQSSDDCLLLTISKDVKT